MTKIQNLRNLEVEMRSVARGERPAPHDAAHPSFESVDALVRLLTPENRALLKTIRDAQPKSISELERLTGRKGPNLLRTLGKLAAIGLVRLHEEKRRTVPTVVVGKLFVEIDPYAMNDRVKVA
jgi:predicted transcriptional regulator